MADANLGHVSSCEILLKFCQVVYHERVRDDLANVPKARRKSWGVGGLLKVFPRTGIVVVALSTKLPLGVWGSLSQTRDMSNAVALQPVSWQRMAQGIDDVKRRLERAPSALAKVGVRYAVVGENAVAAWVSRVDASAVRNTRDVDILLRREDMERARVALEGAGFVHSRVASLGKAAAMDVFLDGPDAKVRDEVHILWAGEKAVPDAIEPTPELHETEPADGFELVPLEDLVRMKLTSFRDKDRMHLRDLISVGLVNASWMGRCSGTLAERLQMILDDPEG